MKYLLIAAVLLAVLIFAASGDDCLYYASTLHQVQHFCACGNRRPLLISTDFLHPFEREGLRRLVRQERVGRDDLPTGRLETIDLKAVKERAMTQPLVFASNPPSADAGVASVMVEEPMPKLR